MRRIAGPLALVVLLLSAATALADSPIQFTIPDGWTDISPGVPESNYDGVPPALVAQSKGGQFATVAVDLAGMSDGFVENLNVVVNDTTGRVTDSLAKELAESLPKQMEAGGAVTATPVEHGVIDVGGVHFARIVTDVNAGGAEVREIAFLVPGREKSVVLTCSASRDVFDRYLPAFEAVARSAVGAVEPPSSSGRILSRALGGAVIGAIIGLVVALGKKFGKG